MAYFVTNCISLSRSLTASAFVHEKLTEFVSIKTLCIETDIDIHECHQCSTKHVHAQIHANKKESYRSKDLVFVSFKVSFNSARTVKKLLLRIQFFIKSSTSS